MKSEQNPQWRAGIVEGGEVVEIEGRTTVSDMLARRNRVGELRSSGHRHGIGDVILHAPVPRPGKIVAAIVNTKGMLGGDDVQLERPRLDMKAPSTIIGPEERVLAPPSGIRPEVELAAVVGAVISRATPEEARKSIFGYTVLNDVTAPSDSRDDAYEAYRREPKSGRIEKRTMRGPLFRSKNHDTFCPLGPWIVTADEAGPVGSRRMSTRFDGMQVQDGNTSEYLFSPEEIASYVSGFLTLEPGDVVSCGSVGWTPEALGGLDPTEFVLPQKKGTLELEIEGIGRLRNPVIGMAQSDP